VVIEYEVFTNTAAEVRRTGRRERRLYYLRAGDRRVGPYINELDARLAMARTAAVLERRRLAAKARELVGEDQLRESRRPAAKAAA
jgi:hypothetical protein